MSLQTPTIRHARRAGPIQFGLLGDWSRFEIDLPIVDLPVELEGKRILHLSDTHFRPAWTDGYDRLLAEIEQLDVDLIAFTGDWLEDKFDVRSGRDTAIRFAGRLRSRFGVYACVGNHDGDLLAPYLIDAGINVLVGESRRIVGGDASIEIIGLPGVSRDDLSPVMIDAFGEPPPGAFRLVLSHFPDVITRIGGPMRPHLLLAGHTHGGQVCLPGGRPLITHDSLPREQSSGLHRIGESWVHVTRGIGCSAWLVRTWCAAEMTVIRIISA